MGKDTYGAVASDDPNQDDSANEGVTFEASSPQEAREQAQEFIDDNDLGGTVNAVIDEDTGEETRFD